MFDSLRDQNTGNPPADMESSLAVGPGLEVSGPSRPVEGLFLGMTAPQRLVIAILLMIAVCVLGTMCLMVTGRIGFF